MKFKKMLATSMAMALLSGSVLHVSAAEAAQNNYKEKNPESLIIDVEAYKAAYSDLEEAFGDDREAYIKHYLTIGVYEGRTKGVLFDPLLYAEAYSDVKAAFGYDISSIVNHYLTHGITENRTIGTANGYADLAAAEKAGTQNPITQRSTLAAAGYENSTIISSNHTANNTSADNSTNTINSSSVIDNSSNVINNNMISNNANNNANNNASVNSNNAAAGSNTGNNQSYHHTTSIYDDDEKTLLRVEYYDDNNKLIQYSSVNNFDTNTNSYTENIYHYDEETETSVLDRTDTYVNGALSSSENNE